MNKNEIIDLVLQLPLPAGHFEASGKVVCLNSAFTKLLGYTIAEIPTVEAHWELFFPDVAYREKVQKDWVAMLEESEKTGIPIQPMLLDIVALNGEVKKLEVHSLQVGTLAITMWIDFTQQLKYQNELIAISLMDELTQTNNRKSYNKRISESISLYNRYKTPFSILMYDIDNFKHINDEYGHDVGDKVLIEMSNFVKTLIRENDYLFRVGGEEFIIILSDTNIEDGKSVSEKICKKVSELQIIEGEKTTISIGLTEVKDGDTDDSIYKRIDSLLYFSKKNGKNRVST